MRFTGEQTVFLCEEYGETVVPLSLVIVNGELSVYPEIANNGYFDLRYGGGRLTLRAGKYVGLIPISDRVAIHVQPFVD